MNRCWVGLLVGVGVCASSNVATAEDKPARFSLRWSAPDECADDARLVHQIEQLLGESLLDAEDQSLTVRATVLGNATQGYSAKLSFSTPRGIEERSLEHPSCEKLVDAIALVIALAIDPERVRATRSAVEAGDRAAAPAPEPEPAPPVAVPPPVQPAAPVSAVPVRDPVPTSPRRLRLDWRAAVHGIVGLGPLPGLAAGVEASLGWHRRWLRLELLGRYWLLSPAATVDNAPPSAKIDLSLATLGVRGCGVSASGDWHLAACGGADLGRESGTGSNLARNRSSDAWYAQIAGSAQVAYTRSRLAPEAGLELSAAVARPGFGVSQNGQAADVTFRPAALGLSLFLGVSFEP